MFWVLVASHSLSVFLVLINIMISVSRQKVYMAVQCVNIVSLFAQNLVIIYSVQTLLQATSTGGADTKTMHEWLRVEVYVFISYMAASILFLFVRSCKRHQVHLNRVKNVAEAHKRDFLEQNLALFSVMQAFAVPFFTQFALLLATDEADYFDGTLAAIQMC